MASDFPAYVAQGAEHTVVRDYTPGQGGTETFIPGDFVVFDAGVGDDMIRCGTNPASIAGISEVNSENHRVITADGKVPIRLLTSTHVLLALSSATTPAASHIGDSYGITRTAGGHWQLDTTKTAGTSRMRVVDVDITNGIFYCRPHANALQFADVEATIS